MCTHLSLELLAEFLEMHICVELHVKAVTSLFFFLVGEVRQ